jgi:lyso-ornithine lipid O-acyltransferase
MRRLRLYARITRLGMVVAVGLLFASGLKLQALLRLRRSPALRQRLCRWFLARLAGALPFEVRLTGSRPDLPMLWLANHLSWTDIPLLGMLQPMTSAGSLPKQGRASYAGVAATAARSTSSLPRICSTAAPC